jgi:hypothetical protein
MSSFHSQKNKPGRRLRPGTHINSNMRRRIASQPDRPASRPRRNQRRGKTRSQRHPPIGVTLYYDPHANKPAPTLCDPELQRVVRRGLAQARTILAQRGSKMLIGCVLLDIHHREGYWLDKDD